MIDSEIQDIILDNALRARSKYKNWQDGSITESDLILVLTEELGELAAALRNRHEDPPEYELIQIGGIVHNWLVQCNTGNVLAAAQSEKERHPYAR